jgi:hypothetical protein
VDQSLNSVPAAGTRAGGHGVANKLIPAVLRAPLLHRLLSGDLMLVTFTGRTSGKRFTTPVTNTPTDAGVAFFSNRRWWTNLRGGAPVTLRLRGRDVAGWAEPVEDRETVAREARAYLGRRGAGSAGRGRRVLPRAAVPSDRELRDALRDHVVVFVAVDGG